jgi:hypothetical protein
LNGRIPAGRQSLVSIMAVRLSRPAHLIDIKAVGGLDVLAVRDETMRRLFASAVAMLSAFGWWNLGFIIGAVLLVPLGLAIESSSDPMDRLPVAAQCRLCYCGISALRSSSSSKPKPWVIGALVRQVWAVATSDWGDRLVRESGSLGSATLSAHLTRSTAARSEAASTSRRYGFSTGVKPLLHRLPSVLAVAGARQVATRLSVRVVPN